jgi:hypothetical protein
MAPMNAPTQAPAGSAQASFDLAKRVEQYVKLRDMIKEKDKAHKETIAPFKETLEQLNSVLLGHLNTIVGDSVRTESGTVYRTDKVSVSVEDMSVFWSWIVTQGDFDLLDKKANVTACQAFLEEHTHLPPGVKMTTRHVVGVRRK